MQENEYFLWGFSRHRCEFTLTDGALLVGVISSFFKTLKGPQEYYFLDSKKNVAFQEFQKDNNEVGMRTCCQAVDLSTISSIVILD